MHIIQNYTMKKNIVKKILPLVMALLKGIKKGRKKERSFIFSTTAHTDKRYSSWIIQNYITYIWQKSWLIRICSALCLLMTWTARATAFHFSGSLGTTCTRTSFNNSIADSPTHRYGESIFVYEYLHEFEAKIETARKLVCGTYFFGLTVVINERILWSLQ